MKKLKKAKYGVTTDEIMDYLKEYVPTKEDLKQYATKEDLKKFATKEDLKQFATKEDLTYQIGKFRSDMIDFIDKRLLDLKGDLVVLMKTEDQKVIALVQLLVHKKLISDQEAQQVVKIDPFRQSHVYSRV